MIFLRMNTITTTAGANMLRLYLLEPLLNRLVALKQTVNGFVQV